MTTVLIVLLVLSWLIFSVTVMLMDPKWNGLGAIGWMSIWGSNEYWSKKSLDATLKKTAIVSGAVFTLVCLAYPYL